MVMNMANLLLVRGKANSGEREGIPEGVIAFSPLDAAGCMRVFLMARENFPELKPKEINGYCHLGLATPGQARISDNYPAVVEIAGDGIKITLYCGEETEGISTNDLLTGISGSLTTALRNAREHDRVKELSVRDSLTGLYTKQMINTHPTEGDYH
jgi:hypothetical protein